MEHLTIIPESELNGHRLLQVVAIIVMIASIFPWLSMIYFVRENGRLETLAINYRMGEWVESARVDRMQAQGCFEKFAHPVNANEKRTTN